MAADGTTQVLAADSGRVLVTGHMESLTFVQDEHPDLAIWDPMPFLAP